METTMGWMLVGLVACEALTGLDQLDAVPADFPLTIEGETGVITSPRDSEQVSLDLVFDKVDAARSAWEGLRAQAEGKGFVVVEEGKHGKRDTVVLEGPQGKLELGCCLQRADRRQLAFVSWWPTP
jgi:hypothetical protein